VEAHPTVASHLIGPGGINLKELERETNRSVFVRGSNECDIQELKIIRIGTRAEVETLALPVREGEHIEVVIEERHASNPKNGIARVAGYVIDIESGGHRVGDKVRIEIVRVLRTFATGRLVVEEFSLKDHQEPILDSSLGAE
jgi:ribonuclease G